MPYVTRQQGTIIGAFALPQNKGQEFVPENDPEVVAFRARPTGPPPDEKVDLETMDNPLWDGLVGVLAKRFGVARADIIAQLKAERARP